VTTAVLVNFGDLAALMLLEAAAPRVAGPLMQKFRLSRRAVLRGAAGVAIALPWLEIMEPERSVHAAVRPAQRFIGVFTPGGTVLENWRPTGSENDYQLSTILQPLEAVKGRALVLSGLDMKSAIGEQNQSGLVAWLTGTPQGPSPGFATGPSLDQVLARRFPNRPLSSLELAVRWGTGKSHGLVHPINIASFADSAGFAPVPPRLDPVQIWNELFGGRADGQVQWDRSILDAVADRYARLAQRLGSVDRQRLEAHLAKIRELEQAVEHGTVYGCQGPELIDTSDYDPAAGLLSEDSGSVRDEATDAAIPKVGKLMMDMLVLALSCDLTRVATLMWSDTEAKHTFPWLDLHEHLHYYMNDGGYHPIEMTRIGRWYTEQHAYLIDQLARTPGPSGSLLDDAVLFFGSNLQHPATHAKTDMPFLLAGNGGGLRTGRWLQYEHQSHNDLLVSLANLFGDEREKFGDERYCQGPLGGLT
jgi:hypothetical protein